MSNSNNNHNHPHGHLSQPAQNPNPSWNPLQIPSYIPRQPQLAHMSNERNMVRSPLTWHTTAQPPDAIYNFMSAANHKNLEHHQMNPLLAPPYVSGTLPFDSMDLSLQSSRSATSPLNKSASQQQQQQQAHGPPTQQQQQQHQQHLHSPSSYSTIHNLSANAPSSAHSQVQHISQQHPHNVHQSPAHAPPPPMSPAAAAASAKYLNTNGSDCESLLPPSSAAVAAAAAAAVAASSSSNTGATNYLPTSCEETYGKMTQIKRNYDNESKSTQKPIELVSKDCSYPTSGLSNKLGTHSLHSGGHGASKKNSPMRNYPQQQQPQHHLPHHHHQQQQQQQHLQSYNMSPMSTANMKYNSPQTPPTPHSLIMQQQQNAMTAHHHQIHSPSGAGVQGHGPPPSPSDSNQLHLQHHMHTLNYGLSHHQVQQQQQQEQQQHHHYGQPPLAQHHSQQMSQSHQQQQQQQQIQAHLNQQLSQPQPPHQQQLHSRSSSSNAPSINSTHLTNLDTLPKHATSSREELKSIEEQHPPPVIADLSTTTTYKTQPPPNATPADLERSTSMPDVAPESPFTGTSNEESLESNSNSSSSRVRRKRKSSQVMRLTPNEKVILPPEHNEQTQFTQQQQHHHQQQQQQLPQQHNERTPNRCSNSRSPKQSPASENKSPRGNFSLNLTLNSSNHDKQPNNEVTTQYSPANRPAMKSPKTREQEGVANKVISSEVIPTRRMSGNNESNNVNNSNVFHEGCEDSPRTKKQRQALIQRNISEMQPQLISEASSSPKASKENDKAASTTDAAAITTEVASSNIKAMLPAPPSPHSISSSSSSSNSSGGSHTTHSSRSNSNDNQAVEERREERESSNVVPPTTIRPLSPAILEQETDTKHSSHSTHSTSEEIKEFSNLPKIETEKKSSEESPIEMQKFEEVENKLEEMFAGIEDEPPANENEPQTPNTRRPSTRSATEDDLSLALELDTTPCSKDIVTTAPQPEQCESRQTPLPSTPTPPAAASLPRQPQIQGPPEKPRLDSRPIATKAAMKSTMPSPPRQQSPDLESPEEEKIKRPTSTPPPTSTPTPPATAPALAPPPPSTSIQNSPGTQSPANVTNLPVTNRRQIARRRNSTGIDPSLLRITMEKEVQAKKAPMPRKKPQKKNTPPTPTPPPAARPLPISIPFDDDQPSTSAAAAAALAAREREEREAAAEMEQMQAALEKSESTSTPSTNSKKKNTPKSGGQKMPKAASGTTPKGGGGGNKKGSKTAAKQQQKQTRNKAAQSSDEETLLTHSTVTATVKETTNNVGLDMKHKSPFILIKPNRTITVINAATADEVNEKQAKVKKPLNYGHERKTIRGMHSSTLSNRYDADTTDSTWICVFCKRGPHRKGLGDLFGPYLVTMDCDEYRAAINAYGSQDFNMLFTNKRKRVDMVKARERNLPVVPATLATAQLQLQQQQISSKGGQRRKRKTIDEQSPTLLAQSKDSSGCSVGAGASDPLDCTAETTLIEHFRGMLKTSENSYEVWLHEDCAVWAPNVLLVGARIVGLDAAIWDSTRYCCTICSQPGGIVCCLQRDCKAISHVPCANEAQWSLNETDFKVYCQKHAQRQASSSPDKLQHQQQNLP